MRIRYMLVATLVAGALAAPLRAQDTTTKKPGGLNKVAHNISKTSKKAGQDTKAVVHRDASKTHQALKKAGNDTKAELKKTTGVTSKTPEQGTEPGGVNKVARSVSHASKEAGAKVKHAVKKTSSEAHGEATKLGKAAKDSVKKP
jgi:hypothetical protein